MNAIKISIRLPQNIACVVAKDACAADIIVNFFFRCIGSEAVHIRQTNNAPQYYVDSGVFYAVAEDATEDYHNINDRLMEGCPKFDGEYIVIDDEFLRALGFKESISQFLEYAAVFGNQQIYWRQARLRADDSE